MKNAGRILYSGFGSMFILQFIFWCQFILTFAFDIPLYMEGFNGIISLFLAVLPPAVYCLLEKKFLFSDEDRKETQLYLSILWICLSCIFTIAATSLIRFNADNDFYSLFAYVAGFVIIGIFLFFRSICSPSASSDSFSDERELSTGQTILFGIIGMTTLQYMYWQNITIDFVLDKSIITIALLTPFLFSALYCIYERCLVFSAHTTAFEKNVLCIAWIIESLIGSIVFQHITFKHPSTIMNVNFSDETALIACVIYIVSFLLIRLLKSKKAFIGGLITMITLLLAVVIGFWSKFTIIDFDSMTYSYDEIQYAYDILENQYQVKTHVKKSYKRKAALDTYTGDYILLSRKDINKVTPKLKKDILALADEIQADENFIGFKYYSENDITDGVSIETKQNTEELSEKAKQLDALIYLYGILTRKTYFDRVRY